MMKHIFIPTDFTENARNALTYALEMALPTNARCTVFHAYDMPYDFASQMENRIVAIEKNAREKLRKLIDQLKTDERYGGLQLEYLLEEGNPERAISDVAEESGADLIVMGLSKHSNLESLTGDNTTAELVDRSIIPVLAIPEGFSYAKPREFVYAAEYRDEDMDNLLDLSQWVQQFDARLRIVHIAKKETSEARQRFRGFSAEVEDRLSYPYISQDLLVANEVEEGILAALGEKSGSILCMAHYHKSFWKDLFGKSHTKEILEKAQVPLMIYFENEG